MTNDQITALVAADPLVREKQTQYHGGAPVPPSTGGLVALAGAELQNEMNALLSEESLRRHLIEADKELTLSSGTDVDRGVRFELPSYVASVISITIGDDYRPLEKKVTRSDFDRWWYESGGTGLTTSDTSQVWTYWGRSADGDMQILISPGTGSDSTALVHYIRELKQPLSISTFPDDIHDLIVLGVKNRLTGFMLQQSYERRLKSAKRRLDPVKGGASPMPHSKDVRNFCWEQSIRSSGPITSDNPLFVSRK